MYLRIFDKPNKRYYKSMAYCKVSQNGNCQFVVLNPYENCFELVDDFDKSEKSYCPLVEYIQLDSEDWVCYEDENLLEYRQYCKKQGKNGDFNFIWGYRDVCENFAFLCAIAERKRIPVREFDITLRTLTDTNEWKYILTQDDADAFMDLFVGFHDATLDRLVFEEQPYMSNAVAVFNNSAWYGIVEICFEKISAINIRPQENYFNDIYEATLIVKDETVFWADDYMEAEDLSYDGTYIKALSMKWRKIG